MRLNLGNPIDGQRAAAIKQVTSSARAAHQTHEDGGGYAMEHAVYACLLGGPSKTPEAVASLDRHLAIQSARMLAISKIHDAPHGAEIGAIIQEFANAIA